MAEEVKDGHLEGLECLNSECLKRIVEAEVECEQALKSSIGIATFKELQRRRNPCMDPIPISYQ